MCGLIRNLTRFPQHLSSPFLSSRVLEMSAAPPATDFKNSVISALQTMYTGELSLPGGKFKAMAYKKAIDNIRRFDGPVTSAEDIKKVDGVGKKIYDKIVEIVATGGLAAAERMKARTDVGAMDALKALDDNGFDAEQLHALRRPVT